MAAVFAILILLIAATPMLTFVGGVISAAALLAMGSIAVALIVLTVPAGELRRLGALWKPIAPIALLPCIWMLIQMVPAPGRLAHSAWSSASAALGESLAGVITLDIGATLLSLCRYSLVLAIAIVATAVSLDRQRAETIFFVLTAATATIAASLVGLDLGFLRFIDTDSLEEAIWRDPKTNLALLPTVKKKPIFHTSEILSAAATKQLFDNLRTAFDYIVVDLPPLAPIVDVRATTPLIDCFILAVEWASTKTDVVQHALHTAPNLHESLIGAVLNKTDMQALKRYDNYHSDYYSNKHYGRYGYTA